MLDKFELKKNGSLVALASINKMAGEQRAEDEFLPELANSEDSVKYFLEIVRTNPELEHVQIVVMNISGPVYTTPSFVQSLSKIKDDKTYPEFIRDIKAIDICEFVQREDYFILDNHLNEDGHRKVADALIKIIRF
jgi:hypothetical protein